MNLRETIAAIQPLNVQAAGQAKQRWASIAKPLNSLGLLESALVRIAGMTGDAEIRLHKRAVVVMCADNGVVEEGVTQCDSSVTAVVAENFTKGAASVNHMSAVAGADVIPVDIGIAKKMEMPGLRDCKIAYGTQNMARGPAMTREQAVCSLETGIAIAQELCGQGYRLLATGEMGIGNTTTSSALAAVLLNRPVEVVTGRGAGLSSVGLERKIAAISKAIAVNKPDPSDAVDSLAKVGGFDIGGMAGVFLGGAAMHVPVLVDGFISAAAALVAARICPQVKDYLLASHVSKEPAGCLLMEDLGLQPFLTADMCLGEGTGAVAAMPILDMANAVYQGMGTFQDIAIEAYQPLN